MVDVAQQVRALDCGSRGRRFEPGLPPNTKAVKLLLDGFFCSRCLIYAFMGNRHTRLPFKIFPIFNCFEFPVAFLKGWMCKY